MAMQIVDAVHTTAQEPQESPLSFFGRARVRLETLIQHGETSLRDLYSVDDDKIRICYLRDGKIVAEAVTRLEMLERTEALGWTPWPATDETEEQISFRDAVPFLDEATSIRWFAGEGAYDPEDNFPLALPPERQDQIRAQSAEYTRQILEDVEKKREANIQKRARGIYLRSLNAEPPALTMEEAVALVRQWQAEDDAKRKAEWEAKYGAEVQA